ncbi:hypothetical protein [Roseomonas sp. AR75]|uniref:hypothetical protein n=1 Tax=Roseomonas sp. AR75 TaxID=2562311 RepID=UPI0010BFABD8|nr:hypothetical protein [Roseomonas sp. AR75]
MSIFSTYWEGRKIDKGCCMPWLPTRVIKEPPDVEQRLEELELSRPKLLRVRDIAFAEAGNATPNHCVNAAGVFSYQHGTWALRDQFVGQLWRPDRLNGVESIKNSVTDIRVVYQNIDKALDDEYQPRPRSAKGGGSEKLCQPNLFGTALPHYRKGDAQPQLVYYLMVDESGACELSCPIVKDSVFTEFVERIYLSDGADFGGQKLPLDEEDAVSDFDPIVARKA